MTDRPQGEQEPVKLTPSERRATQEMNKELPEWLQRTETEIAKEKFRRLAKEKADYLNSLESITPDFPDWLKKYSPEDPEVAAAVVADIETKRAEVARLRDVIGKKLGPKKPPPGEESM